MVSPAPRRSIDSLSPTSPNTIRSEIYPRAGPNARYQTKRGSVTSTVNTIGSSLDLTANWHGVAESGQNAIYTLLQPPIVRSGSIPHTSVSASLANRVPTTRDIPPVTLSPIQKYDIAELKPYMSQVGALFGAFQRAKESEEEEGTFASRESSKIDGVSDLDHSRKLSNLSNNSRHSSLVSTSPLEPPRKRSAVGRRVANVLTPLSTVPSIFFDEDFHLENPRTFDVVSERSELVKPIQAIADEQKDLNGNVAVPRKALATNAILQEKLSWYMDTVEIHLVNSISSASKSFFAALGSLRELHLEASLSVNRIKTLRKDLLSLDEDMAIGGLKIATLKLRKENLKNLSDTIFQLQSIIETIAKCDSLIEGEEVEEALDSVDCLENLVSGEGTYEGNHGKLRDLRGAKSLQTITSDIDTLRYRIGKVFETRFLNLLMNDLKKHLDLASPSDTLQLWNLSSQRTRGHNRDHSSPAYMNITTDFRSSLSANLIGLYRARHVSPATAAYRESVLKEVRNIIRRQLPTSSEDDTESVASASTVGGGKPRSQQEKMSILARNLRSLEADDAEELLKKVYTGISEILRRIGTQGKVLLDITSSFEENKSSPNSPLSPVGVIDARLSKESFRVNNCRETQEELHLTLNISDLVGQAVDIAQDKIVKLLRVRSDQTIHLSVQNFLRYFALNLLFANECEAVSGRSGTTLKNLVNGHIKEFTRLLGELQRQSLATAMEADSWNAKDFAEADDEILSRILSSSVEDVIAWTASCYECSAPNNSHMHNESSDSTNKESLNGILETHANPKTTTRPAIIESKLFILPNSAILCLHGLSSFVHLNTGIPSMTFEIASSMLSYLTLFNSRCTQLILGAGATRSAGLKNITTKHLALASQALSFISTIIPHIREFVRRHISSPNPTLMGEFDKVNRAYLEHQKSICDKLVDIMAGRTTAHIKTMRLIDWSKERDSVNTYMETLTKETSTLHRVLSKHLPEQTVGMIIRLVLENYKEQWSKAFGDINLVSESARERMLRDVEWFKAKIGTLDAVGDVGDSLVSLVRDKTIVRPISAALGLNRASRQVAPMEESDNESKEVQPENEKPTEAA